MRFASFLCFCVFALAMPATAIAQPANDACSNAIPLLVGETSFSTIAATTDGSDLSGFCELGPFGDDNLQNDIWYTFTASNTGDVELSVCGTANFDSRLAVYETEVCPAGPANVIACNDDASGCELLTSKLSFPATAGTKYLIRLGAFRSFQQGYGTLSLIEVVSSESDLCFDGVDNDFDGMTDCDDPECQFDSDADGTPDCADGCPEDPFKIAPENCGCGQPDIDSDADGVLDCDDSCPNDALKTDPGSCGCGVADIDGDLDGTPDCLDGCPQDPEKLEPGSCGCGVSELDSDGDGTLDCWDLCPDDPLKIGPGECGCHNSEVDSDLDGAPDCVDLCPDDPTKIFPGLCGCDIPELDTDGDQICDVFDEDDDGDGVDDTFDIAPLNRFFCQDSDGDGCDDCSSGSMNTSEDGPDVDADGLCNIGDPDADNDGVFNDEDVAPLNRFSCSDLDGDECDDCASGSFNVLADGIDHDNDGLCNEGDVDDDNDGVPDRFDNSPLDRFICGDSDQDGCDDCSSGFFLPANDGPDNDLDGICDVNDNDDDNDGVEDLHDTAPFDRFLCGDFDNDNCEDCLSGISDLQNDGPDNDADGLCDLGDLDDDNDGAVDSNDTAPFDQFVCGDKDEDGCEDCISGLNNIGEDGLDTDDDGLCNIGDLDDDGDNVEDEFDSDPLDRFLCADSDLDACDDCSSGVFDTLNDGLDTDQDGICDESDRDTDGDSIPDVDDLEPLNRFACQDADGDGCDDCFSGTADTFNDGLDTDADGICDETDTDDDNDGINDESDSSPLDPTLCGDSDGDGCEDCQSGISNPADDGLDTDQDGSCDLGDSDDDNDQVEDSLDSSPLNALVCSDLDADSCDDCSSGTFEVNNDGLDTDGDGICNAGDSDDDNDQVEDDLDSSPLDAFACGDADGDQCADCSVLGSPAALNDGADFDADGLCDLGDLDDDNDQVEDLQDTAPNNPNQCGDADLDGCDDCLTGTFNPAEDGTDFDADGLYDLGDQDDDNDGADDIFDSDQFDRFLCSDSDGDGCEDCLTGAFNPNSDGSDFDLDGLCDLGDPDDDNDGVADGSDIDPMNPMLCGDSDQDGCEDCFSGISDPLNDGADSDGDGRCDIGDFDDDNDAVHDNEDPFPFDGNACGDSDLDGCDDCSSGLFDPENDGPDANSDGICDLSDEDIDGDGVLNPEDPDPYNPSICGDVDADSCDDCYNGINEPLNDGLDTDQDGLCDVGDPDDDNDGVSDILDPMPLDPDFCGDSDNDKCDDCSSGLNDATNDGFDSDGDGFCDLGDFDDDNDGIDDVIDSSPNNPNLCGDFDDDGCEDCVSGISDVLNDGLDTDADGLCDLGDSDDDNDGLSDIIDGCPLDHTKASPGQCGCGNPDTDTDRDGMADCVDQCPDNPEKYEPGDCGCEVPDEDSDMDGVSDCIQHMHFIRGDVNQDGQVDISDPIKLLNFLFQAGPEPFCLGAADLNDDTLIDVSDTIYHIAFILAGGPQPPLPFPECGADLTTNTLINCVDFSQCP